MLHKRDDRESLTGHVALKPPDIWNEHEIENGNGTAICSKTDKGRVFALP